LQQAHVHPDTGAFGLPFYFSFRKMMLVASIVCFVVIGILPNPAEPSLSYRLLGKEMLT